MFQKIGPMTIEQMLQCYNKPISFDKTLYEFKVEQYADGSIRKG